MSIVSELEKIVSGGFVLGERLDCLRKEIKEVPVSPLALLRG